MKNIILTPRLIKNLEFVLNKLQDLQSMFKEDEFIYPTKNEIDSVRDIILYAKQNVLQYELLPCPFCGAEGDNIIFADGETNILCVVCFAEGPTPSEYDPEKAASLWNDRNI